MYDSYRIIAFTPAGRRRYLSILVPYIMRDIRRGLIDEWQLWVNTLNKKDVAYIEMLGRNYPQISIRYGENIIKENIRKHLFMPQFFKHITDISTIYIHFDDDTVYVHQNAVESLLRYRIENPEFFIVLGNMVNNAIISYIQQQRGVLTEEYGKVSYHMHDRLTMFSDPKFTHAVHNLFFKKYENNNLMDYFFDSWALKNINTDCSASFFAVFGKDLKLVGDKMKSVPEKWFVWKYPKMIGKSNAICGNALVCHYDFLLEETDILQRYRRLMLWEIFCNVIED